MKKRIIENVFTLIFRIIMSLLSSYIIYPKDKLTAMLLIFILLLQPILGLVTINNLYKTSKDFKIYNLSSMYKKLSLVPYILFLILYIFSITYLRNTDHYVLCITVSLLCLVYGYTIRERGIAIYNMNYLMFNHKLVEIPKLQKIEKSNKEVKVIYFNGKSQILKVRNMDEANTIEQILRRKIKYKDKIKMGQSPIFYFILLFISLFLVYGYLQSLYTS